MTNMTDRKNPNLLDMDQILSQDLSVMSFYFDEGSSGGVPLATLLGLGDKGKVAFSERDRVRVSKLEAVGAGDPKIFNRNAPYSNDLLAESLRSHGTMTMRNIIKKPNLVQPSDEFWPMTIMNMEQNPDAMKAVPDLLNNTTLPTYIPQYITRPFDKHFYLTGYDIITKTSDKTLKDNVSWSMLRLKDISDKFYYGDGSIDGQLGRHKAVMEVYDTVKRLKANNTYKALPYDEWKALMDLRYPINESEISLLGKSPKDLVTQFPDLVRIQRRSDAGVLYSAGKEVVRRESSVGVDLDLADILYSVLASGAKLDELPPLIDPLRLVKMKPKSEVYEQSEFETKTRNIFVSTPGAQMMAQIILSATHKDTKTLLDDENTWSLIGFSPFHGGMTRFVNKVLEKGKDFIGVYADNVYLVAKDDNGVDYLVSMDGSKMEGSIQAIEVAYEMSRSLGLMGGHDAAWQMYATQIYPRFVVDNVAVLGNQQIPIPYMSSGAMGTAYHNTTKSVTFANILHTGFRDKEGWLRLERKGDLMSLKGLKTASEKSGVIFKIERLTPLADLRRRDGQTVLLDLLGFGAYNGAKLGLDDQWLPILEPERMYKSASFLKTDLDNNKKMATIVKNSIKFFRARVFYLLATNDPGLSAMLLVYASQFKRQAMASALDWESVIEAMAESFNLPTLDLAADSLKQLFLNKAIPTTYDVIKLLLDPKGESGNADIFADWVILNSEVPFNYVPLDLYEKFLQENPGLPVPTGAIVAQLDESVVPAKWVERGIDWKKFAEIRKDSTLPAISEGNWSDIMEADERAQKLKGQLEDIGQGGKPGDLPPLEAPKPVKIAKPEVRLAVPDPLLGQITSDLSADSNRIMNDLGRVIADQIRVMMPQFYLGRENWTIKPTAKQEKQGLSVKEILAQILATYLQLPIRLSFAAMRALGVEGKSGAKSNVLQQIDQKELLKFLDSSQVKNAVGEAKQLK